MRKTLLISFIFLPFYLHGATLTVGGGQRYSTIIAAVSAAQSGDTVAVYSGTYTGKITIKKSNINIISYSGPVSTKIYVPAQQAIYFSHGARNIVLDGFDIYSTLNAGTPIDGLVNLEGSASNNVENVTIKNCYIHDAGNDGDCLKILYSKDILIENCALWNPANRTKGANSFQECVDIRGGLDGVNTDRNITFRGCWLFHEGDKGDALIYAKGGTENILWENNIFGPSGGNGDRDPPVQAGLLGDDDPDRYPYRSQKFVIRNNLFFGLKGECAFAFDGPKQAILYNNVFCKNGNVAMAIITINRNTGAIGGPAVGIYSLNNIFYDNGRKIIYRNRYDAGSNFKRDYNLYYLSGAGGNLNLASEKHSVFANPSFVNAPSIIQFDKTKGPEQIAQVLEKFKITSASSAINKGVDAIAFAGADYPTGVSAMSLKKDAFGEVRPVESAWDIGLHEYKLVSSPKVMIKR